MALERSCPPIAPDVAFNTFNILKTLYDTVQKTENVDPTHPDLRRCLSIDKELGFLETQTRTTFDLSSLEDKKKDTLNAIKRYENRLNRKHQHTIEVPAEESLNTTLNGLKKTRDELTTEFQNFKNDQIQTQKMILDPINLKGTSGQLTGRNREHIEGQFLQATQKLKALNQKFETFIKNKNQFATLLNTKFDAINNSLNDDQRILVSEGRKFGRSSD